MKRMLLLAGTIPHEDISLIEGAALLGDASVTIGDTTFPVSRGTGAMIGAACTVASFFGNPPPHCIIGGDIGKRTGSRLVYRHLIKHFPRLGADVAGLHYIVPDIALHNQMLTSIRKAATKPCLIADAGFMYVAKASGQSSFYDLFLPDIGELAFLADEKASHPAYTRGFLTRLEVEPQKLIESAYASGNAARFLCVKGKTDYICEKGAILEEINSPVIEALEPIGGTGDTITGMTVGLIFQGYSIQEAAGIACRANRKAGEILGPTPATQIIEIIRCIPRALKELISPK